MFSYLSFTYGPGGPGNGNLVKDEIENMAQYLNQDTNINHEFRTDDWGNCGISTSGYSDEKKYIYDVVEKLVDENPIMENEVIVIAHDKSHPDFGYGASRHVDLDGYRYFGCTVNANQFAISGWETRAFTWHEVAHCLTLEKETKDHEYGEYDLTPGGTMTHITPLATSYVIDTYDNPDTDYPGSATPPSSFCFGEDNNTDENAWENHSYYHDYDRLSSCTRSAVDDWVDEYFGN